MRSAWCAFSKEMNRLKNKSVHTCPVQTWPGQEVFIYSHPYPRYSWETGWEICSNQLEETSPIDRKNVSHQVHKTTNEQSPTRKKRERNSEGFQCKWIPPEVRMTHACPDLSGLVQTIFGMHLECFFLDHSFFFSIDGTSQGCCQSSDADWCFDAELCPYHSWAFLSTTKWRWHTVSCQITEVKHRRAGLVPGWVTNREHPVLQTHGQTETSSWQSVLVSPPEYSTIHHKVWLESGLE